MGQIQMNAKELIDTARTLVAGDKGLLAMGDAWVGGTRPVADYLPKAT
jgi:hypothetical protein